ncbi:putative nuclear factor related to kappa-B-binding protein [Helianthus annuus]|nr:putative nuclear factor related to kappa-B-binding protein [Helianthus annuus]
MTIEKNSFKVVPGNRLESEVSMSSEDDEFEKRGADLDEDEDDYDSGAGSDDFDLLELGETGEEFCQIGDQTCSIPFELYDLSGLEDVLSMDVWNEVLTEEERLSLAKYLPDMDQEHFMRTMKELFTGANFHFGVPMHKLFDMLKGGLCEPRVSLYRQGLGFFQKHRHYHMIRKHQNTMVNNLVQIHDAWSKCRGYSIDEKLRVLNIMKNQKSLIYEKMEEFDTESSEESADGLWSNKKIKDNKQKWGPGPGSGLGRAQYPGYRASPPLALEPANSRKQNAKGTLKVSGSKMSTTKEQASPFASREANPGPSVSSSFLPRQMRDYEEQTMYDVTLHRDHNLSDRFGKNFKGSRGEEFQEPYMGLPVPLKTDMHTFGRNRTVNQLSDIKVLTAKPSNSRFPFDYGKKLKQSDYNNQNPRGYGLPPMDSQQELFWHQSVGEPVDLYRAGTKKGKTVNTQSGGRVVAAAEGMQMLARGEETESDSSDQFGEDDDDNPLMRSKWAYPSGVKSGPNLKKPKLGGKNSNKNIKDFDGSLQNSRKNIDLRDKHKGKNLFNDANGDGHIEGMFLRKTYPGGKKRKGESGNDYSTPPQMHINNYARKSQMVEGYSQDRHDMVDVRLLECNSATKKRKVKDELMYMDDHDQEGQGQSQSQLDDVYVKSVGKRRWADEISMENMISEANVMDIAEEDAELETKTQKKPFTLITPTVHTGFSFSIIHLLSAVRMAMVTLLPEDNVNDEVKQEVVNGDQGVTSCDANVNPNVPSLTVKDIVNRVRSNPGDPCILETQEPLQDLVRGVLKIFSSRTAPLGAKGWKPLVLYKKSTKSWSWVGPVSQTTSDHEIVEEVTSPESWGLPHKMMVKLVDSFANWLKSGQETLKQIGSLPDPPLALMQVNLDEKERFRDLRAQKSLNTINQSSDEIRDYFRKEEVLRYLIPDRAFAYTAVDGKKSTVAPSRKGAGKPTSKARDHFMLKKDRPPHVTILCLVRDAAARLPGSIGTRADVCTLIRDSQYIVEDVSDAQVNQVVSGALDRLHYERDPCVQFDGERKLWVYLHREREEEDFEDDGTSSTKKWKRQKKETVEPVEPSDQGGAVTLAYHGTGEPTEFDLSVEPSGINNELSGPKNATDQGFDDGRDEDVEVLNITSVS